MLRNGATLDSNAPDRVAKPPYARSVSRAGPDLMEIVAGRSGCQNVDVDLSGLVADE